MKYLKDLYAPLWTVVAPIVVNTIVLAALNSSVAPRGAYEPL